MRLPSALALVAASVAIVSRASAQAVFPVPASNGFDDAPAIQTVLNQAQQWLVASPNLGPAIVSFVPSQTYVLKTYPGQGPFTLQVQNKPANTDWMILQGNGATLMHDRLDGETLGIRSSTKVRVESLKFDRNPRPFMEGLVTTASATQVAVQFLRGLPPNLFPASMPSQWAWLLDPAVPGRPKQRTRTHYTFASVGNAGGGIYNFTFVPGFPDSQDFAPGDRFTFQYREGGSNIQVHSSNETVIHDVTSFAAGSMFVAAEQCIDLVIERCSVLIPSGFWRSTNGDGFHIKCSQKLTIADNYLEGTGDDGINLTSVRDFTVTGNTFVNKNRHVILLDSLDPLPHSPLCSTNNSINGLIQGNIASGNGSSFLAHDGGDYSSVTIQNNALEQNNFSRDVTLNRRVQLIAGAASGLAIRADHGANGIWDAGDVTYLGPVGASGTEFEWDMQDRLANNEHLFTLRAARDQNTWLYLASTLATPTAGTLVALGTPRASDNPSHQKWLVENAPASGAIRIYLSQTNPRLYLSAATTSVPTANTPLELRQLNPTDRNQVWFVRLVED